MSAAADRHRRAAQIELQAAASLGDGGARHALAILRRTELAGRHALDDGALLQQVERLQQAGHGCRSVGMVARTVASTDRAIATVGRRIRRKMKEIRTDLLPRQKNLWAT